MSFNFFYLAVLLYYSLRYYYFLRIQHKTLAKGFYSHQFELSDGSITPRNRLQQQIEIGPRKDADTSCQSHWIDPAILPVPVSCGYRKGKM